MSKDVNISYRGGWFDPRTGRDYTHRITSLSCDREHICRIVVEKGVTVDTLYLSVEVLEELGFFNFNAIKDYMK